jgi:hypothetical protein
VVERPDSQQGREKENLHPENAAGDAVSPLRAQPSATTGDVEVIAMWERSVRDIFAALADEEGSSTFGFSVTASKNPRDGALPAISLPPTPGAFSMRSAAAAPKFMAAGGAKPVEPAFRLSAVNGQQVSGRSAQEIKSMVGAGRLLLRLDVVSGARSESRVVWCRCVAWIKRPSSL